MKMTLLLLLLHCCTAIAFLLLLLIFFCGVKSFMTENFLANNLKLTVKLKSSWKPNSQIAFQLLLNSIRKDYYGYGYPLHAKTLLLYATDCNKRTGLIDSSNKIMNIYSFGRNISYWTILESTSIKTESKPKK